MSFVVRPHSAATVLNLEHVAVEVGNPLPALHRKLQITERVTDKGFDLTPKEARVFVSDVSRAGVTQTRIASDLLKFVEEGIQLSRIERVSELTDEIRSPQQARLGVGLGVVLVLGHWEPRQLDGPTEFDPSR